MGAWPLPVELTALITCLAGPLHGRLAWPLLPLRAGALFAHGRRTVASWLRAAGLGRLPAAHPGMGPPPARELRKTVVLSRPRAVISCRGPGPPLTPCASGPPGRPGR